MNRKAKLEKVRFRIEKKNIIVKSIESKIVKGKIWKSKMLSNNINKYILCIRL